MEKLAHRHTHHNIEECFVGSKGARTLPLTTSHPETGRTDEKAKEVTAKTGLSLISLITPATLQLVLHRRQKVSQTKFTFICHQLFLSTTCLP